MGRYSGSGWAGMVDSMGLDVLSGLLIEKVWRGVWWVVSVGCNIYIHSTTKFPSIPDVPVWNI